MVEEWQSDSFYKKQGRRHGIRHCASLLGIHMGGWGRRNFNVIFVNPEQFTIIGLLIRPFPTKKNTKSRFSLLIIALVTQITQKK